MYDVEARIPYDGNMPGVNNIDGWKDEWEDVFNVPQYETDYREYVEAKKVADHMREFYKHVRVVKWNTNGSKEIVRECPFTQSHTREWCGYSECRES